VGCAGPAAADRQRTQHARLSDNGRSPLFRGGTINEHNASSWCSGTLIGCRTFLTAAHCVEDDQSPSRYWVYLQHAGIQAVASVTMHPSYFPFGFPEFDVAVLKLGAVVTAIEPTPINELMSPPFGTPGMIVGFGQTSSGGNDYGIKRSGLVETSDCTGVVSGLGNTELVCWRYLAPVGPPGDDSNTCNGDSGGPLFVDLGGGTAVAGVTSGGVHDTCLPTDDSYDANVFTYRTFVLGELGTDSTATCGGLPPVGGPDVTVLGNDGYLSGVNPSDSFTVPVTEFAQELRLALTGESNGGFDVDFYVKEGLGASVSSFDCKADGASNVGACLFTYPAIGDWSVFVNRSSGSGEYQVTTTIIAGDPPVCGNGIREFGEECDGADAALCPGECLPIGDPTACGCPVCPASPQTGCTTGEPGRSVVQVKDNDDDTRDRFRWKLGKAESTDLFEFGDPTNDAGVRYRMCMYDASGARSSAEVPSLGTCDGRDCWKVTGTKGFKYKDKAGSTDGITDIKLRAGEDGKTQVQVKARGAGFETPTPPLDSPVVAQLTVSDGESLRCWQTTFSSPTRNQDGTFKAKGP
jgi:hypothetical protein